MANVGTTTGMECPRCNSGANSVRRTWQERDTATGLTVNCRRRVCADCSARWTTIEARKA